MAKLKDIRKMEKNYENDETKSSFLANEITANKELTLINALAAVVLFVIWMLYLFKVFILSDYAYVIINIIMPINIIVLLSSLFLRKTKFIEHPRFKYFILFLFIMVISVSNIAIPKHAMIGWALPIIMANHYYNPKFGRQIFFTVLGMCLICLYAGMFLGEYDANLIGDGVVIQNELGQWVTEHPQNPRERWDYIIDQLNRGGNLSSNRFLAVFIFYYTGRAALLFITFLVSNALSYRTHGLLQKEIKDRQENEKIGAELNVASDIQNSALPTIKINTKEVKCFGSMTPAKEVGGDFYDFVKVDDDHLAFIIGDVSGKGVPGAMFMMKAITLFKLIVRHTLSPKNVLLGMNESLNEGNTSLMFVTTFIGILDIKTGEFTYCNAGHNHPIINTGNGFRYLDCKNGFILGPMASPYLEEEKITLPKGSVILLYTDGITEAKSVSNELYGEKRFLESIKRSYEIDNHVYHPYVMQDIHNFTEGAEQSDDMTFLYISYKSHDYIDEDYDFVMNKDNLKKAMDFISDVAKENKLNKSLTSKISIALDEILSNIEKYALGQRKNRDVNVKIRFMIDYTHNEVNLTIKDDAVMYNPLENKDPDVTLNLEERTEGGLGLFMVKNLMDEVKYEYNHYMNILSMKKKM